jgi:FMNH2-dependent dimethyl sulfone monooxygenase
MLAAVERLHTQGSGDGPDDAFLFPLEVLRRAEEYGFETSLIAARHLGPDPDAWVLASALGASTRTMEMMVAAHPGMHTPQMIAKMAVSLDRVTGGRVSINVINGWNVAEFNLFGNGAWLESALDRHHRMDEFVQVMTRMWGAEPFSFEGKYYRVDEGLMPLKMGRSGPPALYATSASPEGMETIARYCDCWFVPEGMTRTFEEGYAATRADIGRMRVVAERAGRKIGFAMSARIICSEDPAEVAASVAALDAYGSIRRYNKSAATGIAPCLFGTPQVIADRIRAYEDLGIGLMMLNFQPVGAGLETFGQKVLPLLGK